MSDYPSQVFKTFVKGINASVDRYNQPQGSVPRASNLTMAKRGSLITCDGSQILHAFNGVATEGRGKNMANFLFAPTGVPRYYLSIFKCLGISLGPPRGLAIVTAAGGTLAAATYHYGVSAIDGTGGETLLTADVSQVTPLNNKNTLTWNVVPNAVGYNIYRGTTSGGKTLLLGADIPVSQPALGSLTQSFVDTGADPSSSVYTVSSGSCQSITDNHLPGPARRFTYKATFLLPSTVGLQAGMTFIYTPGTNAGFGTVTWTITSVVDSVSILAQTVQNATIAINVGSITTGGSFNVSVAPPIADTSQQTALYRMPTIVGSTAILPVSYNDSNIVAFFPADPPRIDGGGGGGVGVGGGGGTGSGSGGAGTGAGATSGSTPSGGIPMNVSFIPEIVQFSNRACIALGNGYPLQIFSDPNTTSNPATVGVITNITVDGFGVVTVTCAGGHGIPDGGDGANVLIKGVTVAAYNGTFTTLQRVSATVYKVRNLAAIGSGASATGTSTTTTIPVVSTFTQPFPSWATGVTYLAGDVVVPTVANGHYYKVIQGGISGTQPAWPTGSGQQVAEVTPSAIIWQEAGLTNSTAPPPPGAGHVKVFAGSLWVWNTYLSNTANGLDGPCCIRMSDSNNPNSWNPINQAFLDKDDGQEGGGLNAFTISGFGIPPEGSLVAFKQYSGYQIVGVFGSPNFLIQRIKSDLGCVAPRTIQFTTGFGLTRLSHLGFAVYDGINDRIISEDVHPYIFSTDDVDTEDIETVDFSWIGVAWAAQTAHPPMYVCAMPVGDSGGALTRLFCYDLVLKAFVIVDLPFRISTIAFMITNVAIPVTLMGSFNDGCLHRWQAGDQQWDNTIDAPGPSDVAWSVTPPMVYNNRSQGGKVYCRRIVVRGKITEAAATFLPSLELQGETAVQADFTRYNLGQDGTFSLDIPVDSSVTNLDLILSGTGAMEINSFDFQTKPISATVPPILDQGRTA